MFMINKTRLSDLGKRFAADRRGMTSIETAMMFGVFAVGFALLATSILDKSGNKNYAQNDSYFDQPVDNFVTGSISKSRHYTIRKSVLQPSKTSKCIILSDGRRFGDC